MSFRFFRFFSCAALLVLSLPLFAQDRAADVKTAFARAQHLKHGINASEWFAQHSHDYSAKYTDGYTDDADIALMAKLGFDSVRLSIDPVPLEQSMNHSGSGPNADFLARLDRVVEQKTMQILRESRGAPVAIGRFLAQAFQADCHKIARQFWPQTAWRHRLV